MAAGSVAAGSVAQDILLPTSPGPYVVTIRTSELQDSNPQDPLAPPDSPHLRRLMVSVFSPVVTENEHECKSPYMPALVGAVEGMKILYRAGLGYFLDNPNFHGSQPYLQHIDDGKLRCRPVTFTEKVVCIPKTQHL